MSWSASLAHRSRPARARKPHAPTSSSSPSTGRSCPRRWRDCRTGPAAFVIDANNPIEAPLFKPVDLEGPGIERGRRRSRARSARRQGVQSSPRRSAGRGPAVGRRTARAVLFRQRQRREGGGGGAHRSDRLRRHRSRIAGGRRQACAISRRAAAEPEPCQGRLMAHASDQAGAARGRRGQ